MSALALRIVPAQPLDNYGLLAEHASLVRTGPDPDAIPEPQRYAAPTYDGPVLLDRINNNYVGNNPKTGGLEPLYQGLYLESDPTRDPHGEIIRGTRSDPGFAFGEKLVIAGLGAIAGAGIGSAFAGGEAAAAGAEGGEVLGGAESLSGASAESSVASTEVGAGAANEVSFSQAAKTIQTTLGLAKAWANYRVGTRDGGIEGAADVSPVYSAPWGKPGVDDVPLKSRATTTDLALPFAIFGLFFIVFLFFLKGR